MVDQILNSISKTINANLQLLKELCESEIEKIFLLKVLDYCVKRCDQYEISFIVKETEIKNNEIVSQVNYQGNGNFGFLCGVKIKHIDFNRCIKLYPQYILYINNPDNALFQLSYRLDFALIVETQKSGGLQKIYCIECDGHDYHNTKDQISKDNKRSQNLILLNNFTVLRYSGTQIYNMKDSEIGQLLSNV